MTLRSGLGVLLATAALALSLGPPAVAATTVTTRDGVLAGQELGGVRSFNGIPFAAPPVGNLRWRAPQPPAAWSGVRDATTPGPRCAQRSGALGNPGSTSEDCLYLNVHTPAQSSGRLPVIVWLHGGGYLIGAGSDYDPAELVTRGDVVVVTVNYRLGALGYLALPGFAAESGSTGNYGFQDQQQALRWVRANIGAFGGDPGNVTIAGESAGGFSVCGHLVAPGSRGLFQRAIAQSSPCSSPLAALAGIDMRARSVRFAARPGLGCTGTPATVVACMRAKPTEALLTALTPDEADDPSLASNAIFLPNVDGTVLPATPRTAILTGRAARVPLLSGTTRDEGALVPLANNDIPGRPLNADTYTSELARVLGEYFPVGSNLSAYFVTHVLYPLRNFPTPPGYDPYVAPAHLGTTAIFTDSVFSCSALNTHQFTAAAGLPTYAYEFNDPAPPTRVPSPAFPLRAVHASELQYLFDRSPFGGTQDFAGMSPAQLALSGRMIDAWASFARTGSPGGGWPRHNPLLPRFMNLAPGQANGPRLAAAFALEHQCAVWSPADIAFTPLLTLVDVFA